MSAQLASSNSFSAHLALAAGVAVSITAPTLASLQDVVGKLQPTEAANDPAAPGKSNAQGPAPVPSSAATAAPADAPKQTAAASTPAAAHAAAQSQASTAAGEQGNGAAASPSPATDAASTASSSEPSASPAVSFDELKKAFLALSTKAGGREKCEGVLKPFNLPKLSAAAPEQYAAILAAIQKASA